MPFQLFRDPVIPAEPAGLSTEELQRYLGVGRNIVSDVARRFGIEKLHGLYVESVVWRQLFGLLPDDDEAVAALREPLADIAWVGQVVGVPRSTIRNCIRAGRWEYPMGVQLGADAAEHPPRLRRWIPALIRARRLGSPAPAFRSVPRLEIADLPRQNELAANPEEAPLDVFSALTAGQLTKSR